MHAAEQIRKELRLLIREMGLLSHNCLNSGMTLAQAHILSYLKQNGPTSCSELQMQLQMDKAALSRILSVLECKQHIATYLDPSDRRAKIITLLSSGIQAMEFADTKANEYITGILEPFIDKAAELAETLKTIRLLALRNNLLNQKERVKIEKLPATYYNSAIQLASEVFSLEQNIPEELMPINHEQQPVWWCTRIGEDLLGTAASWLENGQWHWGRFAVDSRLRGLGFGKKMAVFSLRDTFDLGADRVFLDARTITVIIVKKLGGKVVGMTKPFYGQEITPMTLTKRDFFNNFDAPHTPF